MVYKQIKILVLKKNKKEQKIFNFNNLTVVIAIVSMLLLTGCGSSSSDSDSDEENNTSLCSHNDVIQEFMGLTGETCLDWNDITTFAFFDKNTNEMALGSGLGDCTIDGTTSNYINQYRIRYTLYQSDSSNPMNFIRCGRGHIYGADIGGTKFGGQTIFNVYTEENGSGLQVVQGVAYRQDSNVGDSILGFDIPIFSNIDVGTTVNTLVEASMGINFVNSIMSKKHYDGDGVYVFEAENLHNVPVGTKVKNCTLNRNTIIGPIDPLLWTEVIVCPTFGVVNFSTNISGY